MAVIGYGLAGSVFHARLVAATPGLKLHFVVTGNAERQSQVSRDHPDAQPLGSVDELWSRVAECDLVVVATPNATHASLAEVALDAGRAVVVDKPLALTAAEGRRVVAHARAAGLLLTVFQNRRWDSDQLTLRRLLAEDVLGPVHRYESRFERWRPDVMPGKWRESLPGAEGGGILLDLGSHLVDQAVQLFGPVRAVYAEIDARRGGSDDDAFLALTHASGVHSQLWISALAGAPGPRLRVLGSRGAYVVDALDSQEDALRAGRRPGPDWGAEPDRNWGRLVQGDMTKAVPSERGRWDLFYAGVERALREGTAPPVDPLDAVGVLEILEAARLSAAEGRVVALP